MSTQDSHPAQGDNARPIASPVIFFDGENHPDHPITDFRAVVLPADAVTEEEAGPKVSSAPASADSSASPNPIELKAAATPAPAPAVKASGPNRAPASSPRSSPGRTTTGS